MNVQNAAMRCCDAKLKQVSEFIVGYVKHYVTLKISQAKYIFSQEIAAEMQIKQIKERSFIKDGPEQKSGADATDYPAKKRSKELIWSSWRSLFVCSCFLQGFALK